MDLPFQEIFSIILFIVPGYLVLYVVSLVTDYKHEQETLEKVVQYLLFSAFSYFLAFIVVFLLSLVVDGALEFVLQNNSIFTATAIVVAPVLGYLMGKFYFGEGYPHKHLGESTTKSNSPSIYSRTFDEFGGCWVVCHMKGNYKLKGKILDADLDEQKGEYRISLEHAKKIEGKRSNKLSKRVVINLSDCELVEFE